MLDPFCKIKIKNKIKNGSNNCYEFSLLVKYIHARVCTQHDLRYFFTKTINTFNVNNFSMSVKKHSYCIQ